MKSVIYRPSAPGGGEGKRESAWPPPPPPLARPPAILDDSDAFLCKLTAEKTQQTQTIDDDLSRIMTFSNYYIPVNTKNTCFPPAMQSVAQEGEGGGSILVMVPGSLTRIGLRPPWRILTIHFIYSGGARNNAQFLQQQNFPYINCINPLSLSLF